MIFYIDFENVQSVGMHGVEALDESDRVCVFYSELNCRLTFSLMQDILQTKAAIEFVEVTVTAPNALDFQLVTKLGSDVALFPDETFVIISKDNGYNAVLLFWRKHNINIYQHKNISQAALSINDGIKVIENDPELQKVLNLIPEYPADAEKVLAIISSCNSKTDIHNMFVKEYGFPKTSYIYQSIKPLIKNKKASPAVNSAPQNAAMAPVGKETAAKTAPAVKAKDNAPETLPEPLPEKTAHEPEEKAKAKQKPAAEKDTEQPEKKKRGRPKKEKESEPALPELIIQCGGDLDRIEEMILKYKTKLGVSNALEREYGIRKAKKIYGLITPLLKDKKGRDAYSG